MNKETTPNIAIKVKTTYMPAQSDPANNQFVFSYTITIRNDSAQAAKLLTRHWVITDGDNQVQEVKGEGVVGMQPHLQPGESFEYSSGCVLKTPVGVMQGSYQMIRDDSSLFDAPIAAFTLAIPNIFH